MYLGGTLYADSNTHVFQMDMQYIEDSVLFEQSIIEIGAGQGRNLQLASDGKIYFTNDEGTVFVMKAGKEFVKLAEHQLGATCMVTPAIQKGKMFFRTVDGIVAIGK